jgi:hypothetical protein
MDEVHIPGRDLMATVFAGFSVLSGTPEALAPVRDLRGVVFVDSLKEMEGQLVRAVWKIEGTIGPAGNLLARDPDGNMLEFVEESAGNIGLGSNPPGGTRPQFLGKSASFWAARGLWAKPPGVAS